MPDDILYEKLLSAAYRFVSYRPRSEKEFRDFLNQKLKKRKVYDIAVIPRVIRRLSELGYVDDEAFARWWVDSRMRFRPKGTRVLTMELLRKGVAKSVIQTAITAIHKEASINEKDVVYALAKKKIGLWTALPRLQRKRKLFEFLLRRGFEGEVISDVVDELVSDGVQ